MRLACLVVLALLAASCRGGSAAPADPAKLLAAATPRTLAAGSAEISGEDTIVGVGSTDQVAGAIAFDGERGRLRSNGQESIYDGDVEYAEIFAGTARPWSRTRLRPKDVTTLHHRLFMLYLASGATKVQDLGAEKVDGVSARHLGARVDPSRLGAKLPPWLARAQPFIARNDYGGKPFDADFWIDHDGRVRRVEAHLENVPFGKERADVVLAMDLRGFGTEVDVTPPPASQIFQG